MAALGLRLGECRKVHEGGFVTGWCGAWSRSPRARAHSIVAVCAGRLRRGVVQGLGPGVRAQALHHPATKPCFQNATLRPCKSTDLLL